MNGFVICNGNEAIYFPILSTITSIKTKNNCVMCKCSKLYALLSAVTEKVQAWIFTLHVELSKKGFTYDI
jgi:hypothetical protein